MDSNEDRFLSCNKLLEENLDYCIHIIETRLDKLYGKQVDSFQFEHNEKERTDLSKGVPHSNPYSITSFLQFKAPYIRDFRNFSGPANKDVRQIRELTGAEDVDGLLKNKIWSKEHKHLLKNSVLDHYAQNHLVKLIKQKNMLLKQLKEANSGEREIIEAKISLVEEQSEQVKARKEERTFVPCNRTDESVDWLAVSARLPNSSLDAQDCRLMWANKLHWSINDGPWTKEEDVCLLRAVEKYGRNDWDSVADELNSNRLPWQCCSRYHQEFGHSHSSLKPMSEDDMEKIIEVINLCRIGNFVPWNQVMYFVQNHSLLQVKYQWHKLLSERRSSQPWTHQEDVLLLNLVDKFGDRDWNRIANYVPGRSNKGCRERYTMRLRFEKRAVGAWLRKEDETLLSLINRYGTNWSLISTYLPERNNHQLRNRYELLKRDANRVCPIKHRKLYRSEDGFKVVTNNRRERPSTDREIDKRLCEIFSTYQTIKSTSKSLVCRSLQDESIYQNLVQVLKSTMTDREPSGTFVNAVIERALRQRVTFNYDLFSPCIPTIRGYRAWTVQQDYLSQFDMDKEFAENSSELFESDDYRRFLKIATSLFLWPAILSRISAPRLDANKYQVRSIIERDRKNLYEIIRVQKQVTANVTM